MLVFAVSIGEGIEKIGAYAGFAAIIGLAVLSLLYFSTARELKRLREWAGRAPERAAELEARLRAPTARPAAPAAARPAAPAPGAGGAPVPPGSPPRPIPPRPAGAPGTPAAPAAATAAARTAPGAPPAAGGPPLEKTPGAPGAPAVPPADPRDAETGEHDDPPSEELAALGPDELDDLPSEEYTGEFSEEYDLEPPSEELAAGNGGTLPPRPVPPRPVPPVPARPGATAAASRREDEPRRSRRPPVPVIAGAAVVALLALLLVTGVLGGGEDAPPPPNTIGTPQADEGTTSTPRRGTGSGDIGDTTVAVLNGTTIGGLAANVSNRLVRAGYTQGVVTNSADQAQQETIVLFDEGDEEQGRAVAEELELPSGRVRALDESSRALVCPPGETCPERLVVVVVGADRTE